MSSGYLGIDLGTSAVKALVMDEAGRTIAKASRAYPTTAPQQGWAEQSPADWWTATCDAAREAIAASDATIRSVGLSGQLNGFVLLDRFDRPLGEAVIWLDLRAVDDAARLSREHPEDILRLTGNELSAICVLPKLAWFSRHRPDEIARAHRIALAKDYLLLELTGTLATDPSDAGSTAMAGVGGTAWQRELVALAGVSDAMLPEIRPSGEIAGRVSPSAAEATGIPPGTPVATGAGDVAALAVGCGIVEAGRVTITLGTAGHVVSQEGSLPMPRNEGLWRIPHAVPGRNLWLGLIMSGGLSLAWFRGVLAAGGDAPDFTCLEALAAEAPPGANGVRFLPFLEGAATPYRLPDARGAFLHLSSSHGTGDLLRAVMEGVAFNARECVEALRHGGVEPHDIRLAEGGAQSPLWCQTMSDALGRPVSLIGERDTSAAGAAILGRAAFEGTEVAEVADASVWISRRFEPTAARIRALDQAYSSFREDCAKLLNIVQKR
jgi:xylulokinase